jgi:hypothetical protein
MNDFDKPEDLATTEALLATLDGSKMAKNCNAITGGCLRAEDALKVAKMVCLAALRRPGQMVQVAGLCALADDTEVCLGYGAQITTAKRLPV